MMDNPAQNSNQPAEVLITAAEQDLIEQIQSELISLTRVTSDETMDWQQFPFGANWSSTWEGEIYRNLW
ncbi:hypothetical protein IQ230_05590 [Gloeocapsopsis crepidinum LEGE 06123]|uniref:Uncharacterized protein n=1 Tax=Gloeocapsopsis crepidinum LEGE 06123 TaxID=588587 RepID=A0ABR9UNH0_9CHRO|nr:hypothetical protein [Gloeocapsopsis crepidinum]MBE9189841.1 hypothetical protein [Gloeocapsopsis crepidinum LEGE 06123]